MTDDVRKADLTIAQFKKVLPRHMRSVANQLLVDEVNRVINSSAIISDSFRENLVSYASVLKDGRFKASDYLSAVKYISFKLLGSSNTEAYSKTFPDRYQGFLDKGLDQSAISSNITAYNRNKLVNLIYAQTLVPMHVLNANLYQEALNCQVTLMHQAKSEKVRCDAANSVLMQLKIPETQKIELDIGLKEDKTIEELRQSTLALVAQQKTLIQSGALNAQDIAHKKLEISDEGDSNIIEGELIP